MELRHLEYFMAVAEELNFSRAAARLNITQPPLSQQIQQLERELGVPLFHREKKRIQLTGAGELFLVEVRRILAGVSHAVKVAQRAHRGEVGSLVVGFVGSATYDILPAVIREYQLRFPDVHISLYEMSTPEQIEALRQNRIDIGILRPPVSDPALRTNIVQAAPCVLALPKNHPLLEKKEIRLVDTAHFPFVALSRKTWAGLYDEFLSLCNRMGFHPIIRQEALEFQTVIGLVAAGIGIAVVPVSAMNLHTQDVVYRNVKDGMPNAAMGLSWRRDAASPLVDKFVHIAKKFVISGTTQAPGTIHTPGNE
ncbi:MULTISPECIES: LysR family transcriptional regulator [Aneurinibacillus]|jgi:DNA-binding transcriptional LysR family regulator|uniref:LysR family transcriptional regulator n=1 Tax=Aneurinibacillus danicus TaxID=267746 RepID=A0A511V9I7_9BACL|nr:MULTISPECIES: LysR family transcriptional regulator [Aneurinibacillus]GEN34901.1 LysR family transcriptional regulator [Aneurinibacillus danicus]